MSTLRNTLRNFWTRDSSILLGGFILTVFLIVYIWWPLAEEYLKYVDWNDAWWRTMDWLLLGIFGFMTVTIIARANLKTDLLIIFVGVCGGLAIESWGTQTNLWHYYTAERPPLWIIPAWPIASLSIDRITRAILFLTTKDTKVTRDLKKNSFVYFVSFVLNFKTLYWIVFASFLTLMLVFVAPTFDKSFTWLALLLSILLILTPTDHRYAILTFIAGSGLGYYLELWGTTRECWTYYTFQTPPLFAVLAHGMAAVAFWRAGLTVKTAWGNLRKKFSLVSE
ncbi:MAG: hypothetical protein CNIPEHKO_01624 [Anaerolineales bacterium]|nr:hypothetical protein [Anaerolineales bacterium]